jgi:hypothetical protein
MKKNSLLVLVISVLGVTACAKESSVLPNTTEVKVSSSASPLSNNYPTVTSGGSTNNNGSAGYPWGGSKSDFGASNGGTIDSNRWHFGIGLGSGNKYNYALRDSENNQNYIDISTTIVGKNVYIEAKSNLSSKEYLLSYVRDEDNLIVKDKQDSPYFIMTNLSKGTYKLWLEIGKNLVNLKSITID